MYARASACVFVRACMRLSSAAEISARPCAASEKNSFRRSGRESADPVWFSPRATISSNVPRISAHFGRSKEKGEVETAEYGVSNR